MNKMLSALTALAGPVAVMGRTGGSLRCSISVRKSATGTAVTEVGEKIANCTPSEGAGKGLGGMPAD